MHSYEVQQNGNRKKTVMSMITHLSQKGKATEATVTQMEPTFTTPTTALQLPAPTKT